MAEPDPSGMKVVENLAVRDKMRGSMLSQMEQYPVILLPACGIAAFEHRQRRYATGVKEITQFEAQFRKTKMRINLNRWNKSIGRTLSSRSGRLGQIFARYRDARESMRVSISRQSQRGLIRNVAHQRWHFLQPSTLRRAPPPFTGD